MARLGRWIRVGSTVIEILTVETIVCGIAAIPSVALWMQLAAWTSDSPGLRVRSAPCSPFRRTCCSLSC